MQGDIRAPYGRLIGVVFVMLSLQLMPGLTVPGSAQTCVVNNSARLTRAATKPRRTVHRNLLPATNSASQRNPPPLRDVSIGAGVLGPAADSASRVVGPPADSASQEAELPAGSAPWEEEPAANAAWREVELAAGTASRTRVAAVPRGREAEPALTATRAEPFRIAVVGLAHGHVDGFFRRYLARPDVQIVGIFESDSGVASRATARLHLDKALLYSNLEEMLVRTRPQAVVTCTSTFDHRSVIETCARHGVHVMVEKPLAVSLADARAIERAASDGKIQVLVNYETTWYRSNRAAYDLVHENALGDVRKIVVHDGHSGPKEIGCTPDFLRWLTDPRLNGAGALFDFGCYGADLATWLLDGQRPTSVTAVTQQIKPDVYPNVDDEATIVVAYPHAQVIIQASWNWPFNRKDLEVYGRHGSAVTVAGDEIRVRAREDQAEKLITAKPLPAPDDDPITYFRAVVLDGLKPAGLSSLATNLQVMEILDAARRSARTGKTVLLGSAR